MIQIKEKKNCCGCSACVNICPKKCIEMKEDEEGFLYPSVREQDCINCGLCEKCCPIIQAEETSDQLENVYVGYALDEKIRLKSSSGGLFTVIAEYVLEQGGVVYGAAFTEKFMVHHIGIERIEDLEKLRGSKYLQSEIGDSYKRAKKMLEQGKKVLFSGTACQIAGLRQYLRKDYNDLITIDVLCHGTPSPKLWKKYLEEKQKENDDANILDISFRKKKYGWKLFNTEINFSNHKSYECDFVKDSFMKLFLTNICLRPSCHDCKFKGLSRPSDITLGDCWGIENYMPEMDDDKGTSVILIHSAKGQMILDDIKERLNIKKAEIEKALPATADSRKSVLEHPKRKEMFSLLDRDESIKKMVKLVGNKKNTILRRGLRKIKKMLKK